MAIYQGRPGGVLWFDPQVEERTGITRERSARGGCSGSSTPASNEPTSPTAPQYVANIDEPDRHDRPTTTVSRRADLVGLDIGSTVDLAPRADRRSPIAATPSSG